MMKLNIITYLKEDIWFNNTESFSPWHNQAIKYIKILILSAYGFMRDLCILRASALTLYTMLSIVPMIAMLFGMTKGFGYQDILKQNILEQIPEQETMMLQLISFAEKLLDNTKGGLVASIGIVVLLWTVIKVIATIEQSFNEVWNVKKGRQVGKRVGDYLSLMILASMLLIASSSLTVFVKTRVTEFIQSIPVPDFGTSMVLYVLNFSPMVIMWGLFTFTFIFVPNTKVNFKSGLIAGVITGTLYQIVQLTYLNLQIGVSSYNAIYGSFAALPLFIVWLQITWLVVLLGSEFSFYHQNFESYQHHDKYSNISFALKKVLVLQVMHLLIKQFTEAGAALTAHDLAEKTAIPVSVVIQTLALAAQSGLLVEVKKALNEEAAFQPAMDTSLLTVYAVIEALENHGDSRLPDVKGMQPFLDINNAFAETLASSPQNSLIKDIALS